MPGAIRMTFAKSNHSHTDGRQFAAKPAGPVANTVGKPPLNRARLACEWGDVMQELYTEHEQGIASGPGLTALVVYLRPSVRAPLLALLAELGVLVVECKGEQWVRAWSAGQTDFAVVVADESSDHLGLFAEVVGKTRAPVLALVGSAAEFASFERAGAAACAAEADGFDQLASPIKQVSREARRLQGFGITPRQSEQRITVFEDVQFHIDPPYLARDTRSVVLSASECDTLLALSERMGMPVSTEAMEQRLARRSGTASPSPGYIKTIVLRLRRKVDSIGGDSAILGAVRGFGYVLRS